ncbi:hypothetical protein C0993_000256, partial [Termitomyces sp. T159_Od127]
MSPSRNALDALRRSEILIASDTAEYQRSSHVQHMYQIESDSPHAEIGEFAPQDATTNPSLVYAAVTKPGSAYAQLVEDAVR